MLGRIAFVVLLAGACNGAWAADAADPFTGDWTGTIHAGTENKPFGLKGAQAPGQPPALYFSLPEGNLMGLGPMYFTPQDDGYQADFLYFHFKLHPDSSGKKISGTLSFDGNELPFEVTPGKLSVPATEMPVGRTVKPAWTFKTGGPIWSSPAAADGAVYFGGSDGRVYALDAKSGTALWQFVTGGPVFGSPTLDGAALYVLSDDGYLYKLERATGKSLWRFDTHGGQVKRKAFDRLSSRAVVANGTVYVGSADGNVYALDPASGSERWHFGTQDVIHSGPAVADGRLFIGSDDGNLYALNAASGTLLWQYDTRKPVVSTPLAANGLVYVGSRSANLFAFDAATGRVKWRKFYWISWVESAARVREGVLYIGSSDYGCLFALDPVSGRELWRYNTHGEAWPDPAVTEQRVYTGAVGYAGIPRRAGFYALDRQTGKELWRYPMPAGAPPLGNGVNSSPAVDGGRVFFGGLDGVFYAFAEDGG